LKLTKVFKRTLGPKKQKGRVPEKGQSKSRVNHEWEKSCKGVPKKVWGNLAKKKGKARRETMREVRR